MEKFLSLSRFHRFLGWVMLVAAFATTSVLIGGGIQGTFNGMNSLVYLVLLLSALAASFYLFVVMFPELSDW